MEREHHRVIRRLALIAHQTILPEAALLTDNELKEFGWWDLGTAVYNELNKMDEERANGNALYRKT